MLNVSLTLLFAISACVALATLFASLQDAVPRFAALQRELDSSTVVQEMRFRIVGTVVTVIRGHVVTLPVRPRQVRPAQPAGLRVAA